VEDVFRHAEGDGCAVDEIEGMICGVSVVTVVGGVCDGVCARWFATYTSFADGGACILCVLRVTIPVFVSVIETAQVLAE
jgi:hypothetical protein